MKKKKVRASCELARESGEEEASGFGSLPDCLVENIVNRLTFEEKLFTIPIVCRRWNRVSRGQMVEMSERISERMVELLERMPEMFERMGEMLERMGERSDANTFLTSDGNLRLSPNEEHLSQLKDLHFGDFVQQMSQLKHLLFGPFAQQVSQLKNLPFGPFAQQMSQLKHLRFEAKIIKGLIAKVTHVTVDASAY